MATSAGFKQQCPSCEAMVPIRDPKLIGKKIDCPKCKYRFVVEDPRTEEEDEDDVEERKPAKPAKKGADKAAAGKKPGAAKGPAGKAPAGKKKPGLKARPDADDDEEEAPRRKKKGGSSTLFIGLGLGVVALLLLGVGGYFLYASLSSGGSPRKSGSGGGGPGAMAPGSGPSSGEQPKASGPTPNANLVDITNLLPNDTEGVLSVNVSRLLESAAKSMVFQQPLGTSVVGFRAQAFEKHMGFPVTSVVRHVQAANVTNKWRFSVLRTDKPVAEDVLVKSLGLKDPKLTAEGFKVYTVTAALDPLSSFLVGADDESNKPLRFHLYDDQTLIFAQPEAMDKFMAAKRQPEVQKPPSAEGSGTSPTGGPSSGPSSGAPGAMSPGSGSPMPMRPSSGAPSSGAPSSGSPSMSPSSGSPTMSPSMSPSMSPMGMGMSPGATTPAAPPEPTTPPSYTTIRLPLKAVLDRIEESKPAAILSLVFDTKPFAGMRGLLPSGGLPGLEKLGPSQEDPAKVPAIGVSLRQLTSGKLVAAVGVECADEDTAKQLESLFKLGAPLVAETLGKELDTKIGVAEQNTGGGTGMGTGMMSPGSGSSGMMSPGSGPSSGMMSPSSGGTTPMPMGSSSGPSSGMMSPSSGPSSGGMTMTPGSGGTNGSSGSSAPPKPASTLALTRKDTTLVGVADLELKGRAPEQIEHLAKRVVAMVRSAAEMNGRSHVHDLAAALSAYAKKNGHFPQGAATRPTNEARANLPWPPDQRVSFLAELLPYLGDGEFGDLLTGSGFGVIHTDESWRDPDNLLAAQCLIPYYLAADATPTSSWVHFPGVPGTVADTHFVGIAGVGLDAASYPAGDPSVAGKLGVFGYDRMTNVADIKDGLDKTIVMIQVPPDFKTPWLAGGGATLRGVPETDSVRPFVCTRYNDQRGTFALMGDGKVRWIAETISDKDFQALCTISGGETVDLDKVAPEVPAPEGGRSELKTTLPSAPVTPPTPSPTSEPKKEESSSASSSPAELQGTWTLTASEAAGKAEPQDLLKGCHLTVEGDRYTFKMPGGTEEGTLKVDTGHSPKWIDLQPKDSSAGKHLGIYDLTGDTLKVCLHYDLMSKRPTGFTTKDAPAGTTLLTFHRGAAAATKELTPEEKRALEERLKKEERAREEELKKLEHAREEELKKEERAREDALRKQQEQERKAAEEAKKKKK